MKGWTAKRVLALTMEAKQWRVLGDTINANKAYFERVILRASSPRRINCFLGSLLSTVPQVDVYFLFNDDSRDVSLLSEYERAKGSLTQKDMNDNELYLTDYRELKPPWIIILFKFKSPHQTLSTRGVID